MAAMAVATRVLGPSDFGRFEFLSANFKLVLDTLALQLPVAYFNWISRKGHKENTDYASGLVFYWSAGTIVIFAAFIYATTFFGVSGWFWPDVPTVYLWFALALAAAVIFSQLCINLGDGLALTVGIEKIRLVQNILKTAGIILLFGWGLLSLSSYFLIQTGVVILSIAITLYWLASRKVFSSRLFKCWKIEREERAKFNEFAISYARPLMASMLIGFAYVYFDRWFLQLIAGSSEQGYYALSERLGSIIFIFTGAMTPLLAREFAFAHEEGDTARLVGLFDRIKIFIFMAAVAGCFVSVQSGAIVELFAGGKYREAIIPVAIMAFYPIHQTFGQLSGSLLIATGQTRLYAKLAISVMLISTPIAYFLLAPHNFLIPGLALGATGLALKMVLIQFISTNAQLYCNTKFLGISFLKWMVLQFKVIGIIYAISFASHFMSGQLSDSILLTLNTYGVEQSLFNSVFHLALSGIFYAVLIAGLLFWVPAWVGIDKRDLTDLWGKRAARLGL